MKGIFLCHYHEDINKDVAGVRPPIGVPVFRLATRYKKVMRDANR